MTTILAHGTPVFVGDENSERREAKIGGYQDTTESPLCYLVEYTSGEGLIQEWVNPYKIFNEQYVPPVIEQEEETETPNEEQANDEDTDPDAVEADTVVGQSEEE